MVASPKLIKGTVYYNLLQWGMWEGIPYFRGDRSLLCFDTYHEAKNFPYMDHIWNFSLLLITAAPRYVGQEAKRIPPFIASSN